MTFTALWFYLDCFFFNLFIDSSNYTSEPNGNEKCQQVPSGQTASDSPGKVYSKSLCGE